MSPCSRFILWQNPYFWLSFDLLMVFVSVILLFWIIHINPLWFFSQTGSIPPKTARINSDGSVTLFHVDAFSEGDYTCTATNSVGSTTASGRLSINGKTYFIHGENGVTGLNHPHLVGILTVLVNTDTWVKHISKQALFNFTISVLTNVQVIPTHIRTTCIWMRGIRLPTIYSLWSINNNYKIC